MRAVMTETTATFADKKTGKKFSIMKRKFINNEPVHFIDFHDKKGWGVYEDKLENGLTISETLKQEVLL